MLLRRILRRKWNASLRIVQRSEMPKPKQNASPSPRFGGCRLVTILSSNSCNRRRSDSVQVPLVEGSSQPHTASLNSDFLFGLDKQSSATANAPTKNPSSKMECISEDRPAVRDAETETERQPESEIRRLQIGHNTKQQLLQQKMKIEEDNNGRVNGVEGFSQKNIGYSRAISTTREWV
ncbi:hypothetical protein LR48_Vigan06g006900 [Vigna angularis]|uniref:Uncharacterized protein n=2 Tax=Phaseolus angularis TaxID=3914 RepID=A0A0L9UPU1_PHAAN|nr:hypothetical protein LR48_Vigan06g006900 [Vigna angularis]